MDAKICAKCGEDKPAAEFYHGDRTCKACRFAMVRDNRYENSELCRAYNRALAARPYRIEARRQPSIAGGPACGESKYGYDKQNKHKRAAHIVVGNAIRDGLLHRKPCEICGAERVNAYHDDYTNPLAVRWLCATHHNHHYRKLTR